jgi:predicted metal-binding protein
MDKPEINQIIKNQGFNDFKWIEAKKIVVAQWVRFKCMFGCPSYGTKASCPPEVPSINECKEFFNDYQRAILIHINKKLNNLNDRMQWGKEINNQLLQVEKEIFLAGYRKVFLLFMDECQLCKDCNVARTDCHFKQQSRPCPEALGVDVFETAHKFNFPIEVLKDFNEEMNRFSIILVD